MTISYHAGNRIQGLSTDEATPDFSDEYTTNTGWTQVGTTVTVDSGSFPDQVKFNATPNTSDQRVYKSLGVTLSDTNWTADFDFILTAVTTNPDGFIFSLTAGTGEIEGASQDMLGFGYAVPSSANLVYSIFRDGTSTSSGTAITIALSTQYYIRLQRTSATNIRTSVFSDTARTTHISGSPVNSTINSTITGLTHLQHAGRNSAVGTVNFTGAIDNTKIWNNTTTPSALATKLPNVVAGSRFEETDTSKVYYKNDVFSFTSTSGTNTFTPSGSFDVQYLVVAGGGSGGGFYGAGGGAGGFRTATGFAVTAQAYTVTVGAGGVALVGTSGADGVGTSGGNSIFSTITSTGGGRGGAPNGENGASGGSGGGGRAESLGGTGTSGQGNNGGIGAPAPSSGNYAGGGGGGSSAVGGAGTNTVAGNGGAGTANPISGSTSGQLSGGVYYLAGGGGGGYVYSGGTSGAGGLGGGGGGQTNTGVSGTPNTGGGGSGATDTPTITAGYKAGDGGSGIVIIKLTSGSATAIMNSATLTPTTAWSQMS